ncbi:hypothetical protein NDU88_004843 [Pleurodeles waltl]|uniref:Secreted protein n=1 Tax=Pleurodeles waltl TaxID=8319 RepID=A0AAV7NKR2_PLEWA|nr:hypothetical protein NDU88_004843 [Pleurodeles waltl]
MLFAHAPRARLRCLKRAVLGALPWLRWTTLPGQACATQTISRCQSKVVLVTHNDTVQEILYWERHCLLGRVRHRQFLSVNHALSWLPTTTQLRKFSALMLPSYQ